MTFNDRFHNFFPVYAPIFADLRDGECGALFRQLDSSTQVWDGVCPKVLDCILDGTSESIKANMASGSLVLGLSPSILAYLGSRAPEVALLARRRPLLALILAAGSPAVQVLPTYVYDDPASQLAPRPGARRPRWLSELGNVPAAALVLLQYALALAATANTLTVTYHTGLWGINTISCETVYLPMLWVALSGAIHLSAMVALHLQLRPAGGNGGSSSSSSSSSNSSSNGLRGRIGRVLRHELTLCQHHPEKLSVEVQDESLWYIAVSWLTAFLSVIHLLYGTIAFSSAALIGYVDSVQLIARLIASSIVCRAVVMFELAGMRNAKAQAQGSDATEMRLLGNSTTALLSQQPS